MRLEILAEEAGVGDELEVVHGVECSMKKPMAADAVDPRRGL